MKTLGTDKVKRAALILIALGIWTLLAVEIRATMQPRYQLVKLNNTNMYLLDTRTGHTWTSFGPEGISGGKFGDTTPGEEFHPIP